MSFPNALDACGLPCLAASLVLTFSNWFAGPIFGVNSRRMLRQPLYNFLHIPARATADWLLRDEKVRREMMYDANEHLHNSTQCRSRPAA